MLTDIKMPFMDGLELCRRLKQFLPAAKLVVFSGFDDFEYAKQAIQMNVSEYILKPINAAELSAVLRRLKDQLDRERTERQNMEFFRSQYTESLPVLQELFYTRLLDGEFLDYQAAIPQGYTTQVTVSTRELIAAVDRASLIISDRLRSPIRLSAMDQKVQLNCSTSMGKAHDEVDCEMSGEAVSMGFNNKYLMDALKASDCDMVKLEINGALSPMRILPLEGESFLFLVLPVRVKNDD